LLYSLCYGLGSDNLQNAIYLLFSACCVVCRDIGQTAVYLLNSVFVGYALTLGKPHYVCCSGTGQTVDSIFCSVCYVMYNDTGHSAVYLLYCVRCVLCSNYGTNAVYLLCTGCVLWGEVILRRPQYFCYVLCFSLKFSDTELTAVYLLYTVCCEICCDTGHTAVYF
jgi:hypothetical protein